MAPSTSLPAKIPRAPPLEFAAIILAGTEGSRLFPLTTKPEGPLGPHRPPPKHLLPVGGVPVLHRLLRALSASGFRRCEILIAACDDLTRDSVEGDEGHSEGKFLGMECAIRVLPAGCGGSADALRHARAGTEHVVVLPGDLVLEGVGVLGLLADAHRRRGGCTILLSDVGEEDREGIPLKESAKRKKGGLARDEDELEYVCLSSPPDLPPRVILKESKIDVEEDEHNLGATPKLSIPKSRLLLAEGTATLRTDLSDLHVYAFSPWVLELVRARQKLQSVQKELIPLLVSRQWRGIEGAFGKERMPEEVAGGDFAVSACVLPRGSRLVLRACTIPSYLYACREFVVHALHPPEELVKSGSQVPFRPCFEGLGSRVRTQVKFNTLLLPDTELGEKVTIKSSTIGARTKIGSKCKFNNVVVFNDVTIGNNCTIQNSIIGAGVVIGDSVSLNDVQVACGVVVVTGTKLKGESIQAST